MHALVKSGHQYLYSAYYNADCVEEALTVLCQNRRDQRFNSGLQFTWVTFDIHLLCKIDYPIISAISKVY